jgi:hypothetical protein
VDRRQRAGHEREDLIPEVKHDRLLHNNLVHFGAFVMGVSVIPVTRAIFHA